MYGVDNLVEDIRNNLGFEPNRFFRVAWTILCPLIVIILMFLSLLYSDELRYADYIFPSWSIVFGWSMNMSFVLPIPITIVYAFFRYTDSKSTLKERIRSLFRPTMSRRRGKQTFENDSNYRMSSTAPVSLV